MSETMKTCSTCKYSYRAQDRSRHPSIGLLRQYCRNPRYNSLEYTSEMFEEDRKDNRCRFWAPIENEKGEKDNEEQLLGRGA